MLNTLIIFGIFFISIKAQNSDPSPAPDSTGTAMGSPILSTTNNAARIKCTPGTYQLQDQQKLEVTIYFEGGIQADSEFVTTVLDFRKLLTDPSVLTVNLAVGAGIQMANNQISCLANNCEDNNQLACIIDVAQGEDKLDVVYCYLCGQTLSDCAFNIVDANALQACLKDKSDSLLIKTRENMQKSSPQIMEYPTVVFNQVFDPCTAQAAFDDFTTTVCAMLQSGIGVGACDQSPTQDSAPTPSP